MENRSKEDLAKMIARNMAASERTEDRYEPVGGVTDFGEDAYYDDYAPVRTVKKKRPAAQTSKSSGGTKKKSSSKSTGAKSASSKKSSTSAKSKKCTSPNCPNKRSRSSVVVRSGGQSWVNTPRGCCRNVKTSARSSYCSAYPRSWSNK